MAGSSGCPNPCRTLIAVVALLMGWASAVSAQAPPDIPAPGDAVFEVSLTDGSTIIARVTAVEADQIVLTSVGGVRLEIDISQVGAIRPIDGRIVEGEYWRRDRADTRLFFTATGRTLRAGEGYVGTYVIVLPFVALGITDRFTLAAGAPVTLGVLEPFYVAPKIQLVRTDAAQISVGTLLFLDEDDNVGVAYATGTFGGSDNALTAGLGFGYYGTEFSNEPVAMIGGEARASRRVKLMTENYFLPGETGLVYSFGLRVIGERFSTDIGIAGYSGEGDDDGCCLPMVNFSYGFGGR